MRRKLFFWLEQLKITPEERITLTVLMSAWLAISLLDLWINPTSAADAEQYQAIQEKFEHRSKIVAQQEANIMSRYKPQSPKQQPALSASVDTGNSPLTESADTTEYDTTSQANTAASNSIIKVNSATLEQLKSLPGVGPVYAERIIAYRDSTDGFKTVDELIKINGIGDKRLEDIRPHVEI